MIGQVFLKTGETPSLIDKSYRKNIDISEYTTKKGTGTLTTGGSGCGKTTKLIKDTKESKNPIIFSYTNKAVENIRSRVDDSLKSNVHTFDSYFNEFKSDAENLKLLANKDVFIDEFSTVPNKWMTLIYHSFVANNLKVNLNGDTNQCDPVEGNRKSTYDYTKSPAILDMCCEINTLKYIKESARYDEKTYNMLSNFLKTGQIKDKLGNCVNTDVNICYYNSTRKVINKSCSNAFSEGKPYTNINSMYNGKKGSYKVCTDTPVICIDNLRDRGMFNSQQFTIKSINKNEVTIKENDQKFSKISERNSI